MTPYGVTRPQWVRADIITWKLYGPRDLWTNFDVIWNSCCISRKTMYNIFEWQICHVSGSESNLKLSTIILRANAKQMAFKFVWRYFRTVFKTDEILITLSWFSSFWQKFYYLAVQSFLVDVLFCTWLFGWLVETYRLTIGARFINLD